jgi:6-phosphogluconolactonase
MAIEEREYGDLQSAAHALACDLAQTLQEAISSRDCASLIVSGGRTPRHVYECLRWQNVNWARVTVGLSDERWVPTDHPESNENLVRSCLLSGLAAEAAFIPLYGGEDTPEAGQRACHARLSAIRRPFDGVYLGVGSDGHFASLFPGDPALSLRDGLCVAVPGTESRQPRMTLTASAILDAGRIFMLFSGAEKRAIYAEAKHPGPIGDLPLRLVLCQERTPVTVLIAP